MVDLRALSAAAGLLTLIAGGPARAAEYPEPVCAKPLEPLATKGTCVLDGPAPQPTDEPAPPPVAEDDRATHEEQAAAEKSGVDERIQPPTADGDPAEREKQGTAATPELQAEEPAKADVADAIDAMCSALESAAAANGLPLEFFVRVIWEESRFQPKAVGPLTRSGLRAQGSRNSCHIRRHSAGCSIPSIRRRRCPRRRSSWRSCAASSAISALPPPPTMPGRAACATLSPGVAACRGRHAIMCAPSPGGRSRSGWRSGARTKKTE